MKAVALPRWDGVSRVLTATQKRAARKAERARVALMTPEEKAAQIRAAEVARLREQYEQNPDALSLRTLSRFAELQPELDDFKIRHSIPSAAELKRLRAAQRYAAQVRATTAWDEEFEEFVWSELALLRDDRQEATGIAWSIDHMYPLRGTTVSGLHAARNWQLIPSWMNFQKQRRLVLTERDQWIACINRPALLAFYEWSDEAKSQIIAEYEGGVYG